MIPRHTFCAALLLAASAPLAAAPFVFRGQLDDGAAPAEGRYALQLTLYGSERSAVPLAGPLELLDVPLTAGRFAVEVDFGALPPYPQAWLEVGAMAAGEPGYTALGTRTQVALDKAAACPAAWALAGNALTNPAVDFLGTSDAQPVELRVDSQRVARFSAQAVAGGNLVNVQLGSTRNTIGPGVRGATIAGGGTPFEFDDPDLGSSPNEVGDAFGTVGGGSGNRAGSGLGGPDDTPWATVAGGVGNVALARSSTVSGGSVNDARGSGATVGGGNRNWAYGAFSVVGGGVENSALGNAAAVGGGRRNCAGADNSWAGGHRAKVRPGSDTGNLSGTGCADVAPSGVLGGDEGTFLWADSQTADFLSGGRDQFGIRARGGVRLNDDTSQYFGAATRQMLNLFNQTYGLGVQNSTLYQRSNSQFAWFRDGAHSDTALEPGSGGSLLMTLGTNSGTPVGVARAQQFVNVSDRHAKTGFAPVDAVEVLARVLQLPLSEWSYKTDTQARHIGPMAQDFHAAFGLGGDDTTIATIDADGVALAAIQGLNARLEAENAELRQQDRALHAALAELRAELQALRAQLRRGGS